MGHAGGLESGRARPGLLAFVLVLEPLHPVYVLVGLQKVAAESDERTCILRDARWQSGSGGRAHFFCTTPGCAESSLCWRIRPTSQLVKHLISWKSARATAGCEHGCELEGGIVVSEVRRRRTRAELELLRVLLLLLPSPPGHFSGKRLRAGCDQSKTPAGLWCWGGRGATLLSGRNGARRCRFVLKGAGVASPQKVELCYSSFLLVVVVILSAATLGGATLGSAVVGVLLMAVTRTRRYSTATGGTGPGEPLRIHHITPRAYEAALRRGSCDEGRGSPLAS